MASEVGWRAIFEEYDIHSHDFDSEPFILKAQQIKDATRHLPKVSDREVRILCKHDTRESRPQLFIDNQLFLLPVKNGEYAIVKGEGYIDVPQIAGVTDIYESELDFTLETAKIGDSEMQHLDFAYATSLIRTFMEDMTLVLTIRGRKYTPEFSFWVGNQKITTKSVQTEVDAGYEGRDQVVLIEAKNSRTSNTIIRQLYYPYRQWSLHTTKHVSTLFFEKQGTEFLLWQFTFDERDNYNSIRLIRSQKFRILEGIDE